MKPIQNEKNRKINQIACQFRAVMIKARTEDVSYKDIHQAISIIEGECREAVQRAHLNQRVS